ncbi:TonB-dependent receptor [Massilibacteroides sp.]|uniref:SusC/RagA family TonB-linked outer membrane protein n=1 Tax=Massilibacteroides sp. TaxID=2034766 RepID=UPI0026025903|nr:TonB-dependent receptor [Massilibacteroides sp.]MDD4516031.1 TonB-dependent receptor [Massilibacteroides sp.]
MDKTWKKSKKISKNDLWRMLILALTILIVGNVYVQAGSVTETSLPIAQQSMKRITGIVTDQNKEPLIGVSVSVKGTTNGTITDLDGKYFLELDSDNTVLVFSYIGYKTQTIVVQSQVLDVVLAEDSKMVDEIVVVGYGIQKKENLTGAVASVNLDKTLESRPITDVGRALQGSVPGLTITTTSGEIGKAPTIKVRGGVGSPNGNSNPLILVDNVEISDISYVNPDDIESISVLKDAASSSIYGARAAFGVILITTKAKKVNEKLRVNYSTNLAWRTPTKTPTQLPGWQQGEINLAGVMRNGSTNYYNVVGNMVVDQKTIDGMKAWSEEYGDGSGLGREMVYGRDFEIDDTGMHFYRTWDWYDMYIKDWMPQQNHNLSVSGGNGKTSYGINLGYLHQEGLTKVNSDQYDRYNTSLTLNTEVNSWLKLRANAMYTKTDMDKPFMYASDLYDHLYYLYRWQPMYPYGTYEGKGFRSALTELEQAQMTRNKTDYMRLGGGLTFTPLPIEGLSFDLDFVYTTTENRYKKYGGQVEAYNIFSAHSSLESMVNSYGNYISSSYDYVQEERGRTQMLTTNAVATYSKTINDHAFKAIAGSNLESSHYRYVSAQRKGLYSIAAPELNLAYGDQVVNSQHTHWAVAGFFGRINYAYKDRYLLEINGRYDGSSKFPSGDQFRFFPSASVGYRVSEEDFMKSLYPALSSLKLRASYGSIGNQDVDANAFRSLMTANPKNAWIINGKNTTSVGTPTVTYSSLTWESVRTVDIGFDARFLDDKIGVTFDWYKRTTTDVLAASTLPLTLGADAPKQNFGELETPGWELAVDFRHDFENGLSINLGGQITDYYTEVTKWAENTNVPTYDGNGNGWFSSKFYKEGMRLGDIWGLKVDRLLQESDFNADGTLKAGLPDQSEIFSGGITLQPGDVLYKDIDGDGKISNAKSTEDTRDQTVIGNMFPRYQYGFTIGAAYKGFDFNMFVQGVGQRKLWAMGNQVLPGYTSGEPYYNGSDDYWTPENTDAFYPRPTIYGQAAKWNYAVNDRYLLNMAYMRLKTLTIGYSLPNTLLSKAHISNLRVYFTGENLFEFDNVKPDIDPEIDVRYVGTSADSRNFGRSYPYQRTLSFGLQITL